MAASTTASYADGVAAPVAGAPGIGDPYFPADGNGGIDVLRYDVHDTYAYGTGRLTGWTRLDHPGHAVAEQLQPRPAAGR